MSKDQVEVVAYNAHDYETVEQAADHGAITTLGVFSPGSLGIDTAVFAASQMAWALGYGISEIGIAIKKQDGTFDDDVHMNY